MQISHLIKITDYKLYKFQSHQNLSNQTNIKKQKTFVLTILMHRSSRFPIIITCLLILFVCSFGQICAISQYFNGQRCALCKSNCKCTSDNTCDTCLSGYAFDATFSNCLQCPTLIDSVNVGCKECCSQISGTAFVCSECPLDSYVFLKGGQCIKSVGCLNLLDTGVCTSCEGGYYLMQGKCQTCDSSCRTCRDDTLCLSCNEGYYNSTNVHYALCPSCPAGCRTCTSAASCQSCNSGFYLSGTSCLACTSNCLTCTATGCTQCNIVSTLISGVCYLCTDGSKSGTAGCQECITSSNAIYCTKASITYHLNGIGQSVLCSTTFPNSLYCNSTTPLQCLDDYHSTLTSRNHLINGLCVPNAKSCKMMKNSAGECESCYFESPNLFYKLSNNECVQCNQLGCKTYSTTCQCLECQSGYRYVNNLCVACQNLHCIKCQTDVQSCQKCATYYGIFSSACILCTKSNCLNCDGDYTLCKSCEDGYYLSSGSCHLCQTNCLLCQSNTKCTQCAFGFYLQSNGRCKMRPSHCLQVDTRYLGENVAVCKKCEYGYQVIEGNCYPCSQALYNLNTCQKYCPSYYALRSYGSKLWASLVLSIGLAVTIFFL